MRFNSKRFLSAWLAGIFALGGIAPASAANQELRTEGGASPTVRAGLEDKLLQPQTRPALDLVLAGLEETDPLDDQAALPPATVILADLDETASWNRDDPVPSRTPALMRLFLQVTRQAPLDDQERAEVGFLSTRDPENIQFRGQTVGITQGLAPEDAERLVIYDNSGANVPEVAPLIGDRAKLYLNPNPHPTPGNPGGVHPLLAAAHQVTGIGSWTVLPASASAQSGNPNHTIYDFGGLGVFLPNRDAPPGTIAKISYWPSVDYHKTMTKEEARQKRSAELFPKLQAAVWPDGSRILPGGEISLVTAGSTTVNVEVVGKSDLIRERYLKKPSFAGRRLVVLDDEGRKYSAGYGVFTLEDPRVTAIAVDRKKSGDLPDRPGQIVRSGRQMADALERFLEIEVAKRLAMLERGGSWTRVAEEIAARPQGQTAAQALFLIARERDPRFGLREIVVEPQLYLPAAAPLYPVSVDLSEEVIQAERQAAGRQIERVGQLDPARPQEAADLLDQLVGQSVVGTRVPDHAVPAFGIDGRAVFQDLVLDLEEPGTFLVLAEDRQQAEVDAPLWALLARLGHRVVIAVKSVSVPGKATASYVEQIIQVHPALQEFEQTGRIEVIETGSRSAGTPLDLASEELKREFTRPDLRAIIARGPENLGTTVARNALTAPVVLLYRSEGKALSELTGLDTDQPRLVVAVVPAGERILRTVPGRPGPLQGTLRELVESEQELEQAARTSQNYRTLVQIFGSEEEAMRRIRAWMRQGRLTFRQAVLGRLHEVTLNRFLQSDALDFVRRQRELERAEAILWGGGSAIGTNMQVANFHMPGQAWGRVLGVTNNTDNGGRTAWIWDALLESLGNTVTVGDSSAGWKGQFLQPVQERLLEPDQKGTWTDPKFWDGTTTKKTQVTPPSTPVPATFRARIEWLLADFARQNAGRDAASPEFIRLAVELMNAAELADQRFLRSDLLPADGKYSRQAFLDQNSVRHMVFTTVLLAAGAYDPAGKTIDRSGYELGDYLWQSAFGLHGRVLPSTLAPAELFATTTDDQEQVVWSSTETFQVPKQAVSDEKETVSRRGQVAVSLNPSHARPGEKIRYGDFGFLDRVAAGEGTFTRLDPEITPGMAAAIENARYGAPSILGPSSTVVSLSAIFSPQVVQALDARPDLAGAYLENLTRNTETNGWNMMDYVRFIEQVTGRPFEQMARYLIVNTRQPQPAAVEAARRLAEIANSSEKPDYQTVLDIWLRHYLSVLSVSRERRLEPGREKVELAQLKEALEWGVNPTGKPATLTPEQQRAVEAAQDLARRASASDTLDYSAAMSWFSQFEMIGRAVEEINGQMDEGFNELVIALGFADHGESVNTYKQRGGVPPLTEAEIAELNRRGITVIEGDLIRTIGEKYTPGEGRVKVPGVYHDLRVIGFIYGQIEQKHRAWLSGGRQGLPFGGGVFHVDREHLDRSSVRDPATGLEEPEVQSWIDSDLQAQILANPASGSWHSRLIQAIPSNQSFYWWFPAAWDFARQHPEMISVDLVRALEAAIPEKGFDRWVATNTPGGGDDSRRFHRHALLWLVEGMTARDRFNAYGTSPVLPEYLDVVEQVRRQVAASDDSDNRRLIQMALEQRGMKVEGEITPFQRQGGTAGAYQALVREDPASAPVRRALKIYFPQSSDGASTFFRTFNEYSRPEMREGLDRRSQIQNGAGSSMSRLFEVIEPQFSGGVTAYFSETSASMDVGVIGLNPIVTIEELAPGEDLQTLMDRRDANWPAAREAALQVYRNVWTAADGWAVLGIKPANVVWDRETGIAKVVDLVEFERVDRSNLERTLESKFPVTLTGLEEVGQERGQTRTLLRSDVSGPVMMEMKGIPQTVFLHRISVSDSIRTVVPGSRLLLAQEGVLPSAVTAQFERRGWAVETLSAEATPKQLAGEVQAGLKEWTGSVLVVAATELEEAVLLLPAEARLTTVFVDRAMVSGMAPNVLLAYLVQSLDAFPGGIRRLESVTQAGVEEFQAIASQL